MLFCEIRVTWFYDVLRDCFYADSRDQCNMVLWCSEGHGFQMELFSPVTRVAEGHRYIHSPNMLLSLNWQV